MRTLVTSHIVRLTGIDEEIGLCTYLNTLLQEVERVLRKYYRVIHSYDNLQLSF